MQLVVPKEHLDKEDPAHQEEDDLAGQHGQRVLQQVHPEVCVSGT